MAGETIRVLIVDDSAVVRRLLTDLIMRDPELELAGAESNGRRALDRLDESRPDCVVLDVEMPEMNGVETAAALRQRRPRLPVIMFSAHTEEGAAITIEALTRGAADFVTKPDASTSLSAVRDQLFAKIKALVRARRPEGRALATPGAGPGPGLVSSPGAASSDNVELICMAVSTGGPAALEAILTNLPATLAAPVVIVQHMPSAFTRFLADRLGARCALRVREASPGDALAPGTVFVAPGDYHVVVRRTGDRGTLSTNQDAPENSCRPSADVLFRSAARAYGAGVLGVVLTGMGQDGLAGCMQIRQEGGRILVQDEATSVVWGMPGVVARAGIAEKILPLDRIAGEILRRVQSNSSRPR